MTRLTSRHTLDVIGLTNIFAKTLHSLLLLIPDRQMLEILSISVVFPHPDRQIHLGYIDICSCIHMFEFVHSSLSEQLIRLALGGAVCGNVHEPLHRYGHRLRRLIDVVSLVLAARPILRPSCGLIAVRPTREQASSGDAGQNQRRTPMNNSAFCCYCCKELHLIAITSLGGGRRRGRRKEEDNQGMDDHSSGKL